MINEANRKRPRAPDDGVIAAEALVTIAIEQWWKAEHSRFDWLQSTADLVELRKEFIETFRVALEATPLLDHFAVSGVIASWWGGKSSGPEGARHAR